MDLARVVETFDDWFGTEEMDEWRATGGDEAHPADGLTVYERGDVVEVEDPFRGGDGSRPFLLVNTDSLPVYWA